MLRIILTLLLLSSVAFASPREEAQDILERFATETNLDNRLEMISRLFLGLPYGKNGPLGEGEDGQYDQDPLYRFDTFDCTTYIETIMALAQTRHVDEFELLLNKIRYQDGSVGYLTRNHFTDLQWIPENIRNGQLRVINELVVAAGEIKQAQAEINFPGWIRSTKIEQIILRNSTIEEKKDRLQELHQEAQNYTIKMATVPYIAIKQLLANPLLLNKIPHGSIVNFVRPNWDLTQVAGTHQNISHQGFLFRKGKTLYLRHASTKGKVEELPFINYLSKFKNHATLKGVHLMKLNL